MSGDVSTQGPWPTATDHMRAIQNGVTSLRDPSLSVLRPRDGLMGLPAAATGQNAIVFDTDGPGGRTALRCFTSAPHRGADVYRRLQQMDLPEVMVPVRWHDAALEVSGTVWPVVTMPWIDGDPLHRWVGEQLHRTQRIRQLADDWVDLARSLMAAGIAHGDLQHGNVLVTGDARLRLIDFDGVLIFDPGSGAPLTAAPSEVGHPNYQHPQRIEEGYSSRYVDTFSELLVHTSLRALVVDPGLWTFHRGENLILSQPDLFEPSRSEVFARMRTSSDPVVVRGADLLARWCASGVAANLTLADALGSGHVPTAGGYRSRAAVRHAAAQAATPVVAWEDVPVEPAAADGPRPAQYRGGAPDVLTPLPAVPVGSGTVAATDLPGAAAHDLVTARTGGGALPGNLLPVALGVLGAGVLLSLLLVSGVAGRFLPGPAPSGPPGLLEVGSCFVIDAEGRVVPQRCGARNDGQVTAQVREPEDCERLAAGGAFAVAEVQGRLYCLTGPVSDPSGT